jgi:hypothetical protein
VDNGDGTVTDYDTGLQWEQKTNDGNFDSVHNFDRTATWYDDTCETLARDTK